MSKWYVKDLSKITGLTVQTLHHYDRLDLLKPCIRQPNGYRLYSETDLMKVQQIIALKSFGFQLAQIKKFFSKEINPMDHIESQVKILDEKAQDLLNASKVMKSILADHKNRKSIPWKKTIELIEVYKMSKQLENKWATDNLSPEELKDYMGWEESLKERFSDFEKQDINQNWQSFVKELQENIQQDPTSDYGIAMGRKCMDTLDILYQPKHASVKLSVWEKGIKKGHGDIPQEVVQWLDKALDTYWRKRLYDILGSVDQADRDTATEWDGIMTEMFGDSKEHRLGVVEEAMTDKNITEAARKWLKSHYKL